MKHKSSATPPREDQTRVLYELCSMIAHIMNFPSPIQSPVAAPAFSSRQPRHVVASMAQVSPAAFASLFIGISLALMLLGSMTFVIGLILMPWVVLLVSLFYVAGLVSTLSKLGRAMLCAAASRHSVPSKIGKFREAETYNQLLN